MTPAAGDDPARKRWTILAVIVLAQTVANIGPLGIPAIASLIRADLGLSLTQAGSFLSAYYIGPIAMSLFAGMLADRWGTAKTLVLGQAVIAAGLIAAMSWFPPRQRATVVGLKHGKFAQCDEPLHSGADRGGV